MANRKDIAATFLQLVVDGRIDEAYERYVNPKGKHHNFYFPAGFDSLKTAMKENHQEAPNKQWRVKHALEDGTMVAMHSHLILRAGDAGMSVVHLFRFEGDLIVEMWDLGATVPEDFPNEDGPF